MSTRLKVGAHMEGSVLHAEWGGRHMHRGFSYEVGGCAGCAILQGASTISK